jgi:aryl-alcohol dehydrogenase-like predicted oxidoreductase
MGMERVRLGRRGIVVSRLGFGTGTAHPGGRISQALMEPAELAELLVYALERGVNFWDTALQYGTHRHVREALKRVRRSEVVITTKLITARRGETAAALHKALRELGTDYVDFCLVHGVRTKRELENRRGALEALQRLREEGKTRAVGLSSHGLSALKAAADEPELDAVWARINAAGLCMDACRLGLYDQVASVAWLKKVVKRVVPKRVRGAIRPGPDRDRLDGAARAAVEETLRSIHGGGKGVVGMKVLGEGALAGEARRSLEYVRNLPFVDALVVGMQTRQEVDDNCRTVNAAP